MRLTLTELTTIRWLMKEFRGFRDEESSFETICRLSIMIRWGIKDVISLIRTGRNSISGTVSKRLRRLRNREEVEEERLLIFRGFEILRDTL